MRKTILTITVITGFAMSCKAGDFTKYVNPMIGTGAVENSLSGNNHPAATVPYGMVQLGPDTHIAPDWYNASGYNYNDSTIYGFTHTRLSGTGASDLIDVSLFPTTTRAESSRFSHAIEIATPGYYGVRLADENIMAELTATPRVGIHRYTYPEAGNMNLWIDMERSANKASLTTTHLNFPVKVWEKYGYMPENVQSQSVSITLEASYDDWCAAQIAQHVGNEADYKHFIARSRNFENLYNHKTHFFQPKDDKGEWIEPFDPLKYGANGGYPFTEGNAWQYYWYVPHDVKRLIELTGGNRMMEKKLDDFFTITDASGEKNDNISGMIGQYAHGNEPSHHVAYLYNYVGKPRKTQDMVHRIMTQLYDNTSAGYSGNDDCGEMSAWYVFGAMGFYPVNPADGTYQLGTPLFTRCTLHLENGKELKIVAKTANKTYYHVRQVKLNGKVLKGTTLKHSDIMNGGLLEFYMCK